MSDAKIIGGMADALWFHAWGRFSPKKACPPTPPAAVQAAKDLLKLYLEVNSVTTMAELVAKSSDWTAKNDLVAFGHRLAMHSLRAPLPYAAPGSPGGFITYAGPQLTLMEPNFEITYDGESLVWDGSDSREWEDNPVAPCRYPGCTSTYAGEHTWHVTKTNPARKGDRQDAYSVPYKDGEQWYRVSWTDKHGRSDSGIYPQSYLENLLGHLRSDFGVTDQMRTVVPETLTSNPADRSPDEIVRIYVMKMQPDAEIDADGMARATHVPVPAAQVALDRLVATGMVKATSDGWYSRRAQGRPPGVPNPGPWIVIHKTGHIEHCASYAAAIELLEAKYGQGTIDAGFADDPKGTAKVEAFVDGAWTYVATITRPSKGLTVGNNRETFDTDD